MISYSAEGVGMPKIKRREVTAWVKRVAQSWGKRVGDIGYLFCSDEHILQVNRQYLGHDYYTDIITFDYCEGDVISGDLVISLDTVRTNSQLYDQHYDSRRFSSPYEAELYRVIIHGVLHLCGQDDKGPGQREQMEAAENRALDLLRA
ncbi:MAG: rRNA maturation RNase YbeY [Prevotella sp.]|nr:rRNA maturation RNase YbeY [Prevotella sp.]